MWAVVAPGEVLATGAAGWADIGGGAPMTPATIMPIGSVSKVLIGLAGAAAIEDGRLDPDAPLSEYMSVPLDFPNGAPRTWTHLATHSAGILDTDAGYEEVGYHYGSVVNPVSLPVFLTRYFGAEGDLYGSDNFGDWAPGDRYAYSNVGAGLAAQALADATGRSFEDLTADSLAPLALAGFWGHTQPEAVTARLYGRDDANAFVALPPYGLATWPDGQFNASSLDLARLMAAILGDGQLDGAQVLRPDVVARMRAPVLTSDARFADGDFVGLFWTRETQVLGPLRLTFEGHSGGDPGVVTFMYQRPGAATAFVLMFNGEPRGLRDILAIVRLARLLAGVPLP